MFALDVTLQVQAASVAVDENNPTVAQLIFSAGSILPLGDGQGAPVPVALVRAPLPRAAIKDLIDSLQKAYDDMDDVSPIQVARDLRGVDKAAEFTEGLRA